MAATLSDSGNHVEGVIAIARSGGHENGHRQGYGIHAIAAGVYRPEGHHGLRSRGSGAVWAKAKANGCRVAGALVSESEVGNHHSVICLCGHDPVAPCVLPFRLSSQLSPPCVPFCVVSSRPSLLLSLLHPDSGADLRLLRGGGVWHLHLCPCLVCSTMVPSLMARNHCV